MKVREDDLKLPPITQMAFCTPPPFPPLFPLVFASGPCQFLYCSLLAQAKQNQWDNCVTCHANSAIAYTWRKEQYVLGAHQFKSSATKGSTNLTAGNSLCCCDVGNLIFIFFVL